MSVDSHIELLDESWEIIGDCTDENTSIGRRPQANPKAVSCGPKVSHRPKSIHPFDIASLSSGLPPPKFDTPSSASSLQREVPEKPLPFTMKKQPTPDSLKISYLDKINEVKPDLDNAHFENFQKQNENSSKSHKRKTAAVLNPPKLTKSSQHSRIARSLKPSDNSFLMQLWWFLLQQVGFESHLYTQVHASSNSQIHIARVLDEFAPSTAMKYLTGIKHFFQLCEDLHIDWIAMTAIQLADLLLVSSLSKSSDPSAVGGKHLIKAMRWLSKTAGVSVLNVFYDKIISSFLNTKKPSDRQETCPLMMHSVVHFERRILQQQASDNEILFLGACLLACWGGLRFADSQRLPLKSFVLSKSCLRGTCSRVKTSHKGQPFGLQSQGFLSHGSFDWVFKYLQILDEVWYKSNIEDLDCIFIQWNDENIHILSYGEALHLLRYYLRCPWSKNPIELPEQSYTLHSLKSTFLAWSAQLPSEITPEEERHIQGHHAMPQSSMRRYSRDDVFLQLRLQRTVREKVLSGWRPETAQHRGAQKPLQELSVQVERFRKPSPPHEWKKFVFHAPHMTEESLSDQPMLVSETAVESSSSSSSSSDSSDSEASPTPKRTAALKQLHNDKGECEEIFVAWSNRIQHAIKKDESSHKHTIMFESVAYRSVCGSYLNPSSQFASNPKCELAFCQRAACKKAWAMFV